MPDATKPRQSAVEAGAIPTATAAGHYVVCPACRRELRIADQYVGQTVACRYCDEPFTVDVSQEAEPPRVAFYLDCPHCDREIRARSKYMGQQVLCKFCDASLRIEERTPERSPRP